MNVHLNVKATLREYLNPYLKLENSINAYAFIFDRTEKFPFFCEIEDTSNNIIKEEEIPIEVKDTSNNIIQPNLILSEINDTTNYNVNADISSSEYPFFCHTFFEFLDDLPQQEIIVDFISIPLKDKKIEQITNLVNQEKYKHIHFRYSQDLYCNLNNSKAFTMYSMKENKIIQVDLTQLYFEDTIVTKNIFLSDKLVGLDNYYVEPMYEKLLISNGNINTLNELVQYIDKNTNLYVTDNYDFRVPNHVKYIGFIYHNINTFPFGNENTDAYFQPDFIAFLDTIQHNIIIDFISCTLHESAIKQINEFAQELKYQHITFRYSLDDTGNLEHGGDWVMEVVTQGPLNVDLTHLYFNEDIVKWKETLDFTLPLNETYFIFGTVGNAQWYKRSDSVWRFTKSNDDNNYCYIESRSDHSLVKVIKFFFRGGNDSYERTKNFYLYGRYSTSENWNFISGLFIYGTYGEMSVNPYDNYPRFAYRYIRVQVLNLDTYCYIQPGSYVKFGSNTSSGSVIKAGPHHWVASNRTELDPLVYKNWANFYTGDYHFFYRHDVFDFNNYTFQYANFNHHIIYYTYSFTSCNFNHSYFMYTSFPYTSLPVVFTECTLQSTYWNYAKLQCVEFTDCDFRYAVFTRSEFIGGGSRLTFTDCDFTNANFSDANMKYVTFTNCNFNNAVFNNAHFNGTKDKRTIFANCTFSNAEFANNHMNYVDFFDCDFTNCMLRDINSSSNVSFRGSKTTRLKKITTYTNINIEVDTEYYGTKEDGTPYSYVMKMNMDELTEHYHIVGPGVNLSGANFSNTDLNTIDFYKIVTGPFIINDGPHHVGLSTYERLKVNDEYYALRNIDSEYYIIGPNYDITGAKLTDVDMENLNVSGVNFTNVDFTGANTGPFLSASDTPLLNTLPNGYVFSDAVENWIVGPGVILKNADLGGAKLSGADMSGVILVDAKTGPLNQDGEPILYEPFKLVKTEEWWIIGEHVILSDAKLNGANFNGINLNLSSIGGAVLTNINWYDVKPGPFNTERGLPAAIDPQYKIVEIPNQYVFYIVGPGVNLGNIDFKDTENISDSEYIVHEQEYQNLDLTNVKMHNADVRNIRFTNSKLGPLRDTTKIEGLNSEYNFVYKEYGESWIVGPELNYSYGDFTDWIDEFKNVNLSESNMYGANLTRVNFKDTNLKNVSMEFVIFDQTITGPLQKTGKPIGLNSNYSFEYGLEWWIVGPNLNLQNANLSNLNLFDKNVENTNFINTIFQNTITGKLKNTTNIKLSDEYTIINDWIVGPGVNLRNANFYNQDLSGIYVDEINFTDVNFDYSITGPMRKLSRLPFVYTLPTDYTYYEKNDTNIWIIGPRVKLLGANLIGADLVTSVLTETNLNGAYMQNTILPSTLERTITGLIQGIPKFTSQEFQIMTANETGQPVSLNWILGPNVNLEGANLHSKLFSNINLSGAIFKNTNLNDATFDNVKLEDTVTGPLANETQNITFREMIGYKLVIQTSDTDMNSLNQRWIAGPDVNLNGAILTGSDLSGVSLERTSLTDVVINEFYGTIKHPGYDNYVITFNDRQFLFGQSLSVDSYIGNIKYNYTVSYNQINDTIMIQNSTDESYTQNIYPQKLIFEPNQLYKISGTNDQLILNLIIMENIDIVKIFKTEDVYIVNRTESNLIVNYTVNFDGLEIGNSNEVSYNKYVNIIDNKTIRLHDNEYIIDLVLNPSKKNLEIYSADTTLNSKDTIVNIGNTYFKLNSIRLKCDQPIKLYVFGYNVLNGNNTLTMNMLKDEQYIASIQTIEDQNNIEKNAQNIPIQVTNFKAHYFQNIRVVIMCKDYESVYVDTLTLIYKLQMSEDNINVIGFDNAGVYMDKNIDEFIEESKDLSHISLKFSTEKHFKDKQFKDINFSYADLSGTSFDNCDFENANFFKANLNNVDFSGTDLNFKNTITGPYYGNAVVHNINYKNYSNDDKHFFLHPEIKKYTIVTHTYTEGKIKVEHDGLDISHRPLYLLSDHVYCVSGNQLNLGMDYSNEIELIKWTNWGNPLNYHKNQNYLYRRYPVLDDNKEIILFSANRDYSIYQKSNVEMVSHFDLSFDYLLPDINATQTNYKPIKMHVLQINIKVKEGINEILNEIIDISGFHTGRSYEIGIFDNFENYQKQINLNKTYINVDVQISFNGEDAYQYYGNYGPIVANISLIAKNEILTGDMHYETIGNQHYFVPKSTGIYNYRGSDSSKQYYKFISYLKHDNIGINKPYVFDLSHEVPIVNFIVPKGKRIKSVLFTNETLLGCKGFEIYGYIKNSYFKLYKYESKSFKNTNHKLDLNKLTPILCDKYQIKFNNFEHSTLFNIKRIVIHVTEPKLYLENIFFEATNIHIEQVIFDLYDHIDYSTELRQKLVVHEINPLELQIMTGYNNVDSADLNKLILKTLYEHDITYFKGKHVENTNVKGTHYIYHKDIKNHTLRESFYCIYRNDDKYVVIGEGVSLVQTQIKNIYIPENVELNYMHYGSTNIGPLDINNPKKTAFIGYYNNEKYMYNLIKCQTKYYIFGSGIDIGNHDNDEYEDFTNIQCDNKYYSFMTFTKCKFIFSNFESTRFLHCRFDDCYFTHSNINRAKFENCIMIDCNFTGASAQFTDLSSIYDDSRIDLTNVSLSTVKLFDNESIKVKLDIYSNEFVDYDADDGINENGKYMKTYNGIYQIKLTGNDTYNLIKISNNQQGAFQGKFTTNQKSATDIFSNECSTSGDPHIYPMYGNSYELPVIPGMYRMIQGERFVINVSTRYLTSKESKEIYDFYYEHTNIVPTNEIINNGVFYEEIYIFSEGKIFTFNFDAPQADENSSVFRIRKIESNNSNIEPTLYSYEVSFDHTVHGKIKVILSYYVNPQNKYGFRVDMEKSDTLSGLLVREYLCETMKINQLSDICNVSGVEGINPKLTSSMYL